MKKNLLIGALSLSLLVSSVHVGAAEKNVTFSDIKGHWAESSIMSMVNRGVVSGFPDRTFKPNAMVTRAEFIKMAADALGLEVYAGKLGEKWYVPYVFSAKQNGVVKDMDLKGDLTKPLTRFEMAKIAVRAVTPNGGDIVFDDKAVMYQATSRGLITGMGKGELGKDKTTTRAQAIAVINRILQVKSGVKLKIDEAATSYAEVEMSGTNSLTMWNGVKMKTLPINADISSNLNMTIHQILIYDLAKKDGAFRDWFPQLGSYGEACTDQYIVAFKMTIKVKKKMKGTDYALEKISSPKMEWTGFMGPSVRPDVQLILSIDYSNLNDYNGWMVYKIEKETYKKMMDHGTERFDLYFDKSSRGIIRLVDYKQEGIE